MVGELDVVGCGDGIDGDRWRKFEKIKMNKAKVSDFLLTFTKKQEEISKQGIKERERRDREKAQRRKRQEKKDVWEERESRIRKVNGMDKMGREFDF